MSRQFHYNVSEEESDEKMMISKKKALLLAIGCGMPVLSCGGTDF